MEYARPDEVQLVLSISTRLEDQMDIIDKFRPTNPGRLLFTKLDETTNFGMILNVCYHAKTPIALLTCGQNVPDDIITLNQMQLARLVCEKNFFRDTLLPEVASKLAQV